MSRRRSWPERLYAAALLLLPAAQRGAWAGEMLGTFRALLGARRERGWWAVASLTVRGVADVVRLAAGARFARLAGWAPRIGRRCLDVRAGGRGGEMWAPTGLSGDLRLAFRRLRRTPATTAVLVLTVALGIGASTAIFSVVRGVLLRPLPYERPEELVLAWHSTSGDPGRVGISGPDLVDYRGARGLTGLAGATALGTTISGPEGPAKVGIAWVTPDFFDVLGVTAALGRTLRPSDGEVTDRTLLTRPGFAPDAVPVVLSHGLWSGRFRSDPAVLGRTVEVNGQPMAVVGVLPADFALHLPRDGFAPTDVGLWTTVPVALDDAARAPGGFTVVGRLDGPEALPRARAALEERAAALRDLHPVHAAAGTRVHIGPLHDEVVASVRPGLWLLLGAVGLVLLVACANVAAILLVRAGAWEREWSVLRALGSGRARLTRQLLLESLALSVGGALVGLAGARLGVDALLATAPPGLPRVEAVAVDPQVVAFSVALCAACAVLFGAAPALASGGVGGPAAGAAPWPTAGGGRGRSGVRAGLIVFEVAVSVVLVAAAGLMLRTFIALQAEDAGFDPAGVTVAHVSLPFFDYRDRGRRLDFYRDLLARVREVPGVEAAGGAVAAPFGTEMEGFTSGFALDPADAGAVQENRLDYRPVLPGYLETIGAHLVAGRFLADGDAREGAARVVVVDEVLARRVWPGRTAVGERLLVTGGGEMGGARLDWAEVVGVVHRVRDRRIDRDGRGALYIPASHYAWFEMALTVRSRDDAEGVGRAVAAAAARTDPRVPVHSVRPLSAYLDDALAPTSLVLSLLGAFALVALTLAAVGVYGLVATSVQQRTTEIGVRIALGAAGGDVVAMVRRRALILTAVGLAVGTAAALVGGGLLSGLLHGVEGTDPLTYLGTAAAFLAVSTLASTIPARRATRVDPVVALRAD